MKALLSIPSPDVFNEVTVLESRRLLVCDSDSLLAGLNPHLDHLLVRIGMQSGDERGTGGRAVLGEESARFVTNAARITQSLGAHRPRPPLWRLLYLAMHAFPDGRRTSTLTLTLTFCFSTFFLPSSNTSSTWALPLLCLLLLLLLLLQLFLLLHHHHHWHWHCGHAGRRIRLTEALRLCFGNRCSC